MVRDKNDRTKIINTIGGEQLELKQLWRMIENPVYAGVNPEKWTQGKPVKCKFDGLVSIELFNAANRGKLTIVEDADGVTIHQRKTPEYLVNKGAKTLSFRSSASLCARYAECHCTVVLRVADMVNTFLHITVTIEAITIEKPKRCLMTQLKLLFHQYGYLQSI